MIVKGDAGGFASHCCSPKAAMLNALFVERLPSMRLIKAPTDRWLARNAATSNLILGTSIMGITPVSDRSIIQQVQNKLAGRGLVSPCHIAVATQSGAVTLTGSVQYAHQKGMAVQAANGIAGVKRVIDRLIVKVAAKH